MMFFFSPRPIYASATATAAAVVIILSIFFASTFAAATLASDEVEALKEIAKSLGKADWNFSLDPCSGKLDWYFSAESGEQIGVTCNHTVSNDTFNHVVSIVLKKQYLNGTLPPALVKLPYLQVIDLTRNYLSGTLPPEWGSMKLQNLTVIANRLTGPVPKEYGNIKTLIKLELEANQLSGPIPPDIGNLTAIQQLNLCSNNFTGKLPDTLANLTALTDFRISDNHFEGKIPDFIQNWPKLNRLNIQASGLDGPIPSRLDSLTSLTDLRISDLNGAEGEFPSLNNSISMKTLILRSCNITGELPNYFQEMKNLQTLDLSFNKLRGTIPDNFSEVVNNTKTNYIYLTGNLLSGTIPKWMYEGEGDEIDLSYNNFTFTPGSSCPKSRTNLFGSSSKSNLSGTVSCLSTPCSKLGHSLYINCGGRKLKADGHTYEEDTDPVTASKSFEYNEAKWAFSSTGHFLDIGKKPQEYISSKDSGGSSKSLWMDARLSPLSLTYYGFCLENGNYIVRLHFAEIVFTSDQTFSSLGRRIFDVYIQGIRVLKDFNIEDKAGVGNETVEKFNASVTNHTLEIRFYWAGRGTTVIPDKGVYGPLISAISVENPDFADEGSISVGTVVGIVVAVSSAIFLVLGILWWKGCFHRKDTKELELKGLDLYTGSFTLRQIRAATSNFDNSNKIGEGGFGPVFKGILSDGTIIAVKQLSSKSKQGNREFVNEIGMISALQHPHLVKLYGCCIEGNQLLLVYEYLENNSLARALFGPKEYRLKLDWPTRHKICIGIARGLAYLHEESRLKIVHRDIKATNVLLDKDLNPKISDFGLAKLDEEENTHISTRIAGTFGYMAPEYAMRGYLTDKADVYSFGIVALEIVSGRSNTSSRPKQEPFYLLDWALALKDKGNLMELVDERLESKFNEEQVMVMINLGILCTNVSPAVRPAMSQVVSILEGRAVIQEFISDQSIKIDMNKPMEMKDKHQQSYVTSSSSGDTQVQSMTINDSWTGTSTSTADLYAVNFESEYWKQRPVSDASSDSPLIP